MAAFPQTSDELLNLIDQSGLIKSDTVRQKLSHSSTKLPAARPLAEWLVQSGLLTSFQAEQMLQGKSSGFFLGNYRVLERLGGGGTASVFLCEHRIMKNRVAIKLLDPMLANDPNNLERFRREARAAAAMSHPNIVKTIDLVEDGDQNFLVMDYVEGVTLSKWLQDHPDASQQSVVRLILQAAQGLDHIHESGLIHRDLKPSNLLLDTHGVVKILDLGLAKFMTDTTELTRIQGANIMGTIDFMAPEQADGVRPHDIRSDIYSLGATLYYMLARGQLPFHQTTFASKMLAIQMQQPKRLTEHRQDIEEPLLDIVERMMAKEPAERFQTPRELIGMLQCWLKSSPKSASSSAKVKPDGAATHSKSACSSAKVKADASTKIVLSQKTQTLRQPVQSTPAAGRGPSRRARRWSLAAAAALLIVVGLFLGKPWRSSRNITPSEPVAGNPGANLDRGKPKPVATNSSANVTSGESPNTGGKSKPVEIAPAMPDSASKNDSNTAAKEERPADLAAVTAKKSAKSPKSPTRQVEAKEPDRQAAEYVLNIGGSVTANGKVYKSIDALPSAPFQLTRINLLGNRQVTDDGLAVFCSCKNITGIDLSATKVTGAGFVHFQNCAGLQSLLLHGTPVRDEGLVHFQNCKNFTSLLLGGTLVSDEGLAYFKGCKHLAALTLYHTGVTDAGLSNFGECKNLTQLNLGSTRVTDVGMEFFKGCTSLTSLDLAATEVGDAGLSFFKDCKNLTRLNMSGSRKVTDAGLAYFNECNLQYVGLGNTKVTSAGLSHLKDGQNLTGLDLGGIEVTDDYLAVVRSFKKLKMLQWRYTPTFGDAQLALIADVKSLTELDVQRTNVTATGISALKLALPQCKVTWGAKGK